MTAFKRDSGPNALRRGRVSIAHANYFVTLCVEPRKPALVDEAAVDLLEETQRMSAESIWTLRTITVMPDHVHALFVLGEHVTLSQAVARLKFATRMVLRSAGTDWQRNFYDHRLRPDDPVEAVIRYIYENPYRSGLVSTDQRWPHFYCRDEDWAWFQGLTEGGRPFPEWLA